MREAFHSALRAIDPRRVTAEAARALQPHARPVTVLALGKAAIGMAWGLADVVPGPLAGVVVAPEAGVVPSGLRLVVGEHPIPGRGSITAGAALMQAASAAPDQGTVVVLISGGGSALAEVPRVGITLDDLQVTTELLVRSGAPIGEINTVRATLSQLKGGGLAATAAGTVATFAISDVVGDVPAMIASGPTVAEPHDSAVDVLARWGLHNAVPPSVRCLVAAPDTTPRRSGAVFTIVASRRQAAGAAAASLAALGITTEVVDTEVTGEAAEVARRLVTVPRPRGVAVYAGETTVTVRGTGTGGRNHEAALAAAVALDGRSDVVFLAAGTDGVDGSAGGAGALVDGATAAAARERGLDPADHLHRNDSGGFFDMVPGRIVTGHTGTNVGDVWMVARL
jgi:glycerate-2-kinase